MKVIPHEAVYIQYVPVKHIYQEHETNAPIVVFKKLIVNPTFSTANSTCYK